MVRYARRVPSDGTTCADPLVAYDTGGDPGASVSSGYEMQRSDQNVLVAHWKLGRGSKLCYVRGWPFDGRPFTRRHDNDASYTMKSSRYQHNHYAPLGYLLIAFRREQLERPAER